MQWLVAPSNCLFLTLHLFPARNVYHLRETDFILGQLLTVQADRAGPLRWGGSRIFTETCFNLEPRPDPTERRTLAGRGEGARR